RDLRLRLADVVRGVLARAEAGAVLSAGGRPVLESGNRRLDLPVVENGEVACTDADAAEGDVGRPREAGAVDLDGVAARVRPGVRVDARHGRQHLRRAVVVRVGEPAVDVDRARLTVLERHRDLLGSRAVRLV